MGHRIFDRHFAHGFIITTIFVGVIFAIFFLCGCVKQCDVNATRCDGNVAQYCGSNGRWLVTADCEAVTRRSGQTFVCGPLPDQGGATCLPIVVVK